MPEKLLYEMQALTYSVKADACLDEAKEKQNEMYSLLSKIETLNKEIDELVALSKDHIKKMYYFKSKAKEAE